MSINNIYLMQSISDAGGSMQTLPDMKVQLR